MSYKMIVFYLVSLVAASALCCSPDDASDEDTSSADSDADSDTDSATETFTDGECVVDANTCGDGGDIVADGGADASCGDFDCATYEGDGGYPFDNEGAPHLGNADSPEVVVTGFSNFGCPHCRDASIVIEEIFGDSAYADRAVFYFGHYVGGSPNGNIHRAAHAAHLQGHFWEAHDYFFGDEFYDPLHGLYLDSEIRAAIENLGILDMAAFDVDVSAQETADFIVRDESEICDFYGSCMSVGTPSIFVNGYLVHPWMKLKNVLNYVLNHTAGKPSDKLPRN